MTFVEDFSRKRQQIEQILSAPPVGEPGDFSHIASQILERRAAILSLCEQQPTPLYAYDPQSFRTALDEFAGAFGRHVPRHQPFFAVKSNHHPYLAAEAVAAGFGLDVSSSRELQLALDVGAQRILFSGPAKSAADLELAVDHRERVIVNLDSFGELALLGKVTALRAPIHSPIRAGVRIHSAAHGNWSKFGIPLPELPRFWRLAA